ncbi:MAG: metallophosphoesterase [Deltaproteobacteria bacterium]|nr:metallophosphoesterase [Deltaproteobacteria bacterium]
MKGQWNRKAVATIALVFGFAGLAQAAILKGPYLQNVTTNAATICIEADSDGVATVEFGPDEDLGQSLGANAWREKTFPDGVRYMYRIRLTGLQEGTTYVYRAIHGGDASDDIVFTTMPDNMTPYRFVSIGDTRNGSPENPNLIHVDIAEAVAAQTPLFYLNTGDFVADGGHYEDWDYHFLVENDLMGISPIIPVFGNHEDGYDGSTGLSGDELWQWYYDTGTGEDARTWFSFDVGNVHVAVVDLQKWWTLLPGMTQIEWLRDDLEKDQLDTKTNFTIVSYHQPAFTYKLGRTPDIAARYMVEPVVRTFGVDLVLSGHDHFYARHELHGIPHVITAGGGAALYDAYPDIETWDGFRAHARDHHYMIAEVASDRIDFEVYSITNGELLDAFSIAAEAPPTTDDDTDDDADDDVDDDGTDDDATDDDTGTPDHDTPSADGGSSGDDDDDGCGC